MSKIPLALMIVTYLVLTVTACVTPGTHTWPGVDVQKANAFRQALYNECILYTNTHNMRPGETLDDLTPKRFIPEDVNVMSMYDAPSGGSYVNFSFRGWNLRKHVDFERGLMSCDPQKGLQESPTLKQYHLPRGEG